MTRKGRRSVYIETRWVGSRRRPVMGAQENGLGTKVNVSAALAIKIIGNDASNLI
jgi:hypothetical protein